MNFPTFALDWPMIILVLVGLVMFGLIYNEWMEKLGSRKEGYLAFYVAGGVLVTVGAAAIIYWPAAVLMLACFVAAGSPMIYGDVSRYADKRERERAADRMKGDD